MKYNGPCADTAGSAGEGLRKKGGTPMRKRNKVVSLLLAGCMAAGLLAGCGSSGEAQVATAEMLQRHQPVLEQRIQQHRRLQVKWTDRSIFARYPLETTSMYRIWDGAG